MKRKSTAQLWKTTKGSRLLLGAVFAATAAAAYLRYGLAVSYQHAVDSLAAGSIRTAMGWLAGGFAMIIVWNSSNYIRMMAGTMVSGAITKRLRNRYVERYLRAPFAETEAVSLGETMTKLTDDIGAASMFFTYSVREICFGLIQLGSGLWFAFGVSPYFGIVLIVSSLLCAASNTYFAPLMRKQYALQQAEEDKLKTFSEDRMQHPAVTELFHLYGAHCDSFRRIMAARTANILCREKMAALFFAFSGFSGYLTLLSLYGAGIALLYYGKISIGGFIGIFQISSVVLWPFEQFPQLFKLMAEEQAAMERLLTFETLPQEAPEEQYEDYRPVGLYAEHVQFRYGDGVPVLQDFTYEAHIGGINCIAGESGSGKTTFVKLLLGLYAPQRGQLFFSDAGGTRYSINRSAVSYVPQDCKLFDKTVLENIRDAKPKASFEEVYAAAVQAGVHTFIKERALQYDTPVGGGSGSFSYGQKQRIAIARALLKDAKLIIFDEPTSALDAESEKLIIELLQTLAKEKIVIAVSHSPALIAASAHTYTMHRKPSAK
ncbi:MAG: ABC transporter ATP-binding protein [Treponema sp.]